MPFNIEEFKKYGVPQGGARPSLFEVQMSPPGVAGDPREITFKCMSASLPGFTTGLIEVPYKGRKIKVAGDRVFQNWQVNIINDEDFNVRAMFERWNNNINTLESNVRLSNTGDIEEYKSRDATVTQFSKFGHNRVLRIYQLVGVWPVNVEPINLDWDRTNTIETFAVELAFDYFVIPEDGQSGAVNQVIADAVNS